MALLGQTTILEAISALILLFTAFSLIFKSIAFKDNWKVGSLAIIGRDVLISLDFTNKIYNASFSDVTLKNFLNKTSLTGETLIISLFPEGTIKENIIVAANCTESKIRKLSEWYNLVVLNRRFINIFFVPTNLTSIPEYSDLLIICGYIDLTNLRTNLLDYLSKGKGIIEISDFGSEIDDVTKEMFGIDLASSFEPVGDINVTLPTSIFSDAYYPYKFFFSVPLVMNASSINTTSGNYIGNFTFRNYTVPFEVDYTSKRVYFRPNTQISVAERSYFTIGDYKFFLSYILSNSSIAISFKKVYNFTNFRGNNNVILTDGNEQRIFLYEASSKRAVAILNKSTVAWIADFDRYNNATHDQKLALLSLILAVSNKERHIPEYSVYKLPYINVESYDMYEVYRATLGISYPSG